MKESLNIRIADHHVAQAFDGKQLRLTKHIDSSSKVTFGNRDPWATGLSDLRSLMVGRGILLPWQTHTHDDAKALVTSRVEPLKAKHAANPRWPITATFGRGDFNLTWNPLTSNGAGGDWTLKNPTHTIARLGGGHDDVGYFPNPFSAVWKTIERKLFAMNETVAYADLGRIVLTIADDLTADLKIGSTR